MEECTSTITTTKQVFCTLCLRQCGWVFVQKPRRVVLLRHSMPTASVVSRSMPGTEAELGQGRCSLTELVAPQNFPHSSWPLGNCLSRHSSPHSQSRDSYCLSTACNQCPNSVRNLLNTVPRSTYVQERTMHLLRQASGPVILQFPLPAVARTDAPACFLAGALCGLQACRCVQHHCRTFP